MSPQSSLVWLRDRLWRLKLHFMSSFRAATQTPGVTVTVLAAAYSIGLPLLAPLVLDEKAKTFPISLPLLISLMIIGSLLALIPLIYVSGIFALITAAPQEYARLVLAGRPPKEVLFVASDHILKVCRLTLEDVDRTVALFERRRKKILEGAQIETERRKMTEFRDSLKRLVQRQHERLLRIEAMKVLAARELDIPQRRLCDHIFQYSPLMHRNRLQRYVDNWEEHLDLQIGKQRQLELYGQDSSFVNNTRRRIRYQRQILENRDLHPYIVQFASTHSTSGSLLTYAKALRFLALTGESALERAGERPSVRRKKVIETTEGRFRFLHRKQKAHPGFDLHALLRQALREIEESRDPGSSLTGTERLLEALESDASAATSLESYISEGVLASFRSLPVTLAEHIDTSRRTIAETFMDIYNSWFDKEEGTRYIVSHGYSRTVVSVLKASLPQGRTQVDKALPWLFFLLSEEEKEGFDTRVMEYELKEEKRLRRFRQFAAGSEHHLLGLLEEKRDAVMILLGAECFDEERHVVHPRGIVRRLDDLLKKLKRSKIPALVVVVAENYKCVPSLTADTKFYGQHFDRIDLYRPNLIHLIVTNRRTLPSAWDMEVKKRKEMVGRMEEGGNPS